VHCAIRGNKSTVKAVAWKLQRVQIGESTPGHGSTMAGTSSALRQGKEKAATASGNHVKPVKALNKVIQLPISAARSGVDPQRLGRRG